MKKALSDYPRTQAIDAFESLTESLNKLCAALTEATPPCWLAWIEKPSVSSVEAALNDFWRSDKLADPRHTPAWPGIVAAGPALCQLAHAVNKRKQALAMALQAIPPEHRSGFLTKEAAEALGRQKRDALSHIRLGRLSVKAACRQIVVIDEEVERLGFTWSSASQSIRKVTVAEAYEMLQELGEPGLTSLPRLAGLDSREVLAQVQRQAPMLRANLVLSSGVRLTRRAQLPIFVLNAESLPLHNEPGMAPVDRASTRMQRSDRRLESDPLAGIIRLYRYQMPTLQARAPEITEPR